MISVSKAERAIIAQIRAEFSNYLMGYDPEFQVRYAGKIIADLNGNIIVKKDKIGADGRMIRKGIDGLNHSFLLGADGSDTAFGRRHEGAYLGKGGFGTVRLGKMFHDDGTEKFVAVKSSTIRKGVNDEYYKEEKNLAQFGRLFSSGRAVLPSVDGEKEKGYLVQEYLRGRTITDIVAGEPSFFEVYNHIMLGPEAMHAYILNAAIQKIASTGLDTPSNWYQWNHMLQDPRLRGAREIKYANEVMQDAIARLAVDLRKPSESNLVALGIEYAEKLQQIHASGFLHRDIKGLNAIGDIEFDSEGRYKYKVGIVDLGLSVTASYASYTVERCGTPGYMAPEVETRGAHSYASDAFSLGVTLRDELGIQSSIVNRLLSHDPHQRPNLAQVVNHLKTVFLTTILNEYTLMPPEQQRAYKLGAAVSQFYPGMESSDNNLVWRVGRLESVMPGIIVELSYANAVLNHKKGHLLPDASSRAAKEFIGVLKAEATVRGIEKALEKWRGFMVSPSGDSLGKSRRDKYRDLFPHLPDLSAQYMSDQDIYSSTFGHGHVGAMKPIQEMPAAHTPAGLPIGYYPEPVKSLETLELLPPQPRPVRGVPPPQTPVEPPPIQYYPDPEPSPKRPRR